MSKRPTPRLTELQLDALRELANIASGHAATALAQMLGTEVDLSVPNALALPRADAIAAYGSADGPVAGVVTPLEGHIEGVVLLMIPSADAETLCRLLGVVPGHRGRRVGAARDRKHPRRLLPERAVGDHRTRAGTLPAPACHRRPRGDLLVAARQAGRQLRAGARAGLRAARRRAAVLDLVPATADRRRRVRAARAARARGRSMIAMGTVSMGELAIASAPGEELVARGLGSCIGLALVDRVAGVAGLAHIVLPEAQDKEGATAKFADRAVPALIAQMCGAGASERRLEAAIAGGAKMFEVSARSGHRRPQRSGGPQRAGHDAAWRFAPPPPAAAADARCASRPEIAP